MYHQRRVYQSIGKTGVEIEYYKEAFKLQIHTDSLPEYRLLLLPEIIKP